MQVITFGQLLRDLRRAKNVSQRELAEKVGVDFSYISKLENDRLPPPAAETIIKIANELKVPSETLLSNTGKVSNAIMEVVTSSPEAIRFMNEAKTMQLRNDEWHFLFGELKKLR